MKTPMIVKAIDDVIAMITPSSKPEDVVRLTQAALNLAHAINVMHNTDPN